MVFSSLRKFNSDSFRFFWKSNLTSGSKVTDYRKLVRRAPQAVFGAYFLYFQSVFLYFRPLVKTRLSLLIQNVTLESEFGDLGPKLWSGGMFWYLHTKLYFGRIWAVFLVFQNRISVCLTSRVVRARSEFSENHLGKSNRRSESKVMDVQSQTKSQCFLVLTQA